MFFDKETDKYIVNKNIQIGRRIDIIGFYNFKLQTLKGKWNELIEIANQNEVYLYSDDTFMELIKFLVDNIEVKSDVVNIMGYNDSYDIYDSKFERIICKEISGKKDESIVAKLITMCPKNINIYCSEIMPNKLKVLLCKIFEKRVKFLSKIN